MAVLKFGSAFACAFVLTTAHYFTRPVTVINDLEREKILEFALILGLWKHLEGRTTEEEEERKRERIKRGERESQLPILIREAIKKVSTHARVQPYSVSESHRL